jgi:DNA-binding beta-propeller fold protein YncE
MRRSGLAKERLGPRAICARVLTTALVVGLVWVPASRSQTVNNPRRLAFGPAGQLLVAERSGSVVAVNRRTLKATSSFVLPNEGAPFGLATLNRLVFVGNTETQNVEVYRMFGSNLQGLRLRFAYNLGYTPPGETGTIAKPISIAVDRAAQLVFVLDGREKKVKIFHFRGPFVNDFAPADGTGEVLSPVSLAVDPVRQEVLVGDYGDPSGFFSASTPARILFYDYQGALLSQIDGDGSTHETTQFARVQGMATSADGRIFAAEPLANHILVLDRTTGELLATVGNEGPNPGELMLPLDVLFDERSGALFVSNNQGARKVELFKYPGRRR